MLMIYTDILEPIVTGDVHARLLRAISLDAYDNAYGCTLVEQFFQRMYLPLLYNTFPTIESDIRDQHGEVIPCNSGTVTVVLYFKRIE